MPNDRATSTFAELARRIHASDRSEDIYQSIVDLAVDLVTGCDHACITLMSNGTATTAASSDPIAALIDELESTLGEGPCLDAVLSEQPQIDDDLTQASPWPALAAQTLARTPVRGAIGFRLLTDGRKSGALNLFSDQAGAFIAQSIDEASVLASFASVAVMTLSARDQAHNLRLALDSNREIGKAIGLLMAAHKVTEQRAFEILGRTSQDLNIKLAEVAARVVRGQESQYPMPATGPA